LLLKIPIKKFRPHGEGDHEVVAGVIRCNHNKKAVGTIIIPTLPGTTCHPAPGGEPLKIPIKKNSAPMGRGTTKWWRG